jgi:heme-degrading monooxygenase HmoA
MHVLLWEFLVKLPHEDDFVRTYRADGDWAALFRRAPGYLGSELCRDVEKPGRYVTVDRWESARAFEDFRARWAAQYEALDAKCAGWTERETPLGRFTAP